MSLDGDLHLLYGKELTIVPAVHGGQYFFVGFDEVRELVHQDASFGAWQQFP